MESKRDLPLPEGEGWGEGRLHLIIKHLHTGTSRFHVRSILR